MTIHERMREHHPELLERPYRGYRYSRFAEQAIDEEAIFANNYTVLHDRTAFSDPAEEPERHLLRLWLESDPPRPVAAETRIYPTSAGVPPQPARTPSYATDVDVV